MRQQTHDNTSQIGDIRISQAVPSSRNLAPAAVASKKQPRKKASDQSSELLRVGDLAKATGKTVRAIHLYEELGLLKPSVRSKGRYRLFGPEAVMRARWITKLQELGWSLGDIKTVVQAGENLSAPGAMAQMRDVYQQQLKATREQISRLKALETELEDSLDYLQRCHTCSTDHDKDSCRSCQLHHEEEPPELVAGLAAQ